ncbi:competence/damage-inducible protein A [Solimonas terrae]|uniref:Competence/damage-inducible protein A n=1 Tax=Solimonas terrae TaxID=1396819 RepID=A0A6M2BM46_9GAMM|nr:competence/damage-inducible protein A [Solimonas terrae]NGY03498.1 competence/damage-inducible protein A [Solimonas terrae]
MALGLFVIGDEILSGKRQDRHFAKVLELLRARGIELGWAQFLGDDELAIAEAVRAVVTRGDELLSCGGIGATPDDCTRQAAALAFGVPLQRHREAEQMLVEHYGAAATPNRLLMTDFPLGAGLIPNPVNQVPGFSFGHCYFVPGFPEMAWPMLEWVLDTQLRYLHCAEPDVEFRLRAIGSSGEGDLLDLMRDTLAGHPGLKLSSLPSRAIAGGPRHIEFGFKGRAAVAAAAYRAFAEGLLRFPDLTIEPLAAPAADN